ncbi:MAG: hypothetical protein SFY32_11260 [Bacteroidota bacterium]|nr:hypothetical protein [Bacteroidota bacterium]
MSNNILQIPYKKLPISNSLKRFFAVYGIPTLEKLLEIKTQDLLKMKWFNIRLWRELIVLLEDNGELDRLV